MVAVGDCDYDEQARPVVMAAREATTNAAKHAGVPRVDVYAEITPVAVDVFVRDRGAGFDPDATPEDRLGVRRSIIDRMERHGGRAEIRSAPGEGTEVRLHLDRRAKESDE
ncbi:ATP-binding protein [Nocardioides convexus]|uniref:sensor histidine kinase n=1 Tax=Nocardioides convexus TaxID=2712224 RepID=UPI003100DDDA